MSIVIGLILIVMVVLIDQIVKILVNTFMTPGQVIRVIPYVFELRFTRNFGAAFGMMQGRWYIFIIVTVLALAFFGYLFASNDFKKKKIYSISTILLIAGTLGNAIDRMFRIGQNSEGFFTGYVIDMLYLPFLEVINFRFIFNIADVALTFGLIFFVIDLLFLEGRRKKALKYEQYDEA